MLDPQITTVLFDLDGTLLPMEVEHFTKTYFGLLAQKGIQNCPVFRDANRGYFYL